MIDLGGLAIFVSAEEADIEVVARIFKIIRITAVKGNLLFGGEDQADVGVFFIAIEVVLSALVKGHHVTAQTSLIERFLFNVGHGSASREKCLRGGEVGLDRRV